MKGFHKFLLTIVFLAFSIGIGNAQPGFQKQIYNAYLDDKIEEWEQIIDKMDGRKADLTVDQLVNLVGYYYGYIGWIIGEGKNKDAKNKLEEADELLEMLLLQHPGNPDLHAFKGAFLGYRIEMNSIRAVVLGPESMKHINHAIEIGPDRPQAWIEHGNALFYMPKMFGGSKEKALESYAKAIRLLEESPATLHDNWMYLNVSLIMGKGYEETEKYQMAKDIYEKTLQFEPGFKTLSEEVYPSLLEKMKTSK